MTAVVKTLTPARPVKSFLSTNIPFLDRNNQDAFSTHFQDDFKPLSIKKARPFCPSTPAQVINKDLRYKKEHLTETMESYHLHPLPKITRTPRWSLLYTNFKMQTDPSEATFLTTQSQNFCPKAFQPPSTLMRPPQSIKIQQVEKLPESTTKATFTPHVGYPIAKAKAKHPESFPTIKGDKQHCSFVSHYNSTFQGAQGKAGESVDKHCSSVVMGDPVKIVDKETNYTTSFGQPIVCRYKPPRVKKRLKLSLRNFTKDSWASTSREAFCHHKLDPVVLPKQDQNVSSLPKWDTDVKHNRELMSNTTNRISFSELNHADHPVHVSGATLITKSNVQFSSPHLSSLYYTSTAQEHYNKKDREQVSPATQLPSNILSGPEHGLWVSSNMAEFLPVKNCRNTPYPSHQESNIKFPLAGQHFSTTHKEHYKARPLMHPGSTDFVMK
ncbi:hypothetical protein Q8A73_009122 [Channa argus]|nr:hypothetical protein Q8A73_009122 [Channa argus]